MRRRNRTANNHLGECRSVRLRSASNCGVDEQSQRMREIWITADLSSKKGYSCSLKLGKKERTEYWVEFFQRFACHRTWITSTVRSLDSDVIITVENLSSSNWCITGYHRSKGLEVIVRHTPCRLHECPLVILQIEWWRVLLQLQSACVMNTNTLFDQQMTWAPNTRHYSTRYLTRQDYREIKTAC